MLIRALTAKKSHATGKRLHMADGFLPLCISQADAQDAFAKPLERQLAALGIGHVNGCGTRHMPGDPGAGIDLFLALVSPHPRILRTVGGLLEELDAPSGSVLQFADSGASHSFGRAEPLALYLDRGLGKQRRLDVLEACVDAMAGVGQYHGSALIGSQAVLYFTGDNYNEMMNALRFVMSQDPNCEGAYVRRSA
ncbi:MAG: hypothetical protein AAGF74_13285 [Pseudomonadota bacterium]